MSDTSLAVPIADERTRRIFGDLAFSSAKRGFDPAEVTAFLVNASGAVERMLARLKDAEERAAAAERNVAALQARVAQPAPAAVPAPVAVAPVPTVVVKEENPGLIDRTLALAEKTAVAAVSDARVRAQAILTQAQDQARQYFATERSAIATEWERIQAETNQLETLRLAVAAETMALEGVRSHLRARIASAANELAAIADDRDLLNYAITCRPSEVEAPTAPALTAVDGGAESAAPEAIEPGMEQHAIEASSVSHPDKSFGAKWQVEDDESDAEAEAFERFFSADVEPEPTQQWILAG